MPAPNDTPPTYVGVRICGVIWPIELPVGEGLCACEEQIGSVSSRGVLICIRCGHALAKPMLRARA